MADQQDIAQVPVVYTNAVRLAMNLTEFRLYLGETLPPGPEMATAEGGFVPQVTARQVDRVCVVISPDIIPQLIDGLSKAIKAYEATFGPLRKAPQVPSTPAKAV